MIVAGAKSVPMIGDSAKPNLYWSLLTMVVLASAELTLRRFYRKCDAGTVHRVINRQTPGSRHREPDV